MKLKEAIDYLRPIMENARLDGYHLALRRVLEAAELQIAKEPEDIHCMSCESDMVFLGGLCPNCRAEITDEDQVCYECGQLITWECKGETNV